MASNGTDRPFKTTRTLKTTGPGDETDLRVRLRLASTLQSSLDLHTILDLFFVEAAAVVPCDGLAYEHGALGIEHEVDRQSVHTCSYRIINQQDALGTLRFARSQRFNEREMALLESLLALLVFPVTNALRYRSAVAAALVDPLTGAGNQASLDEALRREMNRARRYDQCIALAMIDLDHFKRINDGCGHVRGDQVLCAMVDAVHEGIRGSDTVFRYGGEELVVLLSNTNAALAMRISERLRSRIEALELRHGSRLVTTTVSIGVAMLRPEDTISRFLNRADEALYRAKSNGRNIVHLAATADHVGESV